MTDFDTNIDKKTSSKIPAFLNIEEQRLMIGALTLKTLHISLKNAALHAGSSILSLCVRQFYMEIVLQNICLFLLTSSRMLELPPIHEDKPGIVGTVSFHPSDYYADSSL